MYTPSAFSMSTISSFKSIENKHDVYRGNYCLKRFCEPLREHAIELIDFKKKKIKSSPNEQQKSYQNSKICYICEKNWKLTWSGAVHSICNLKYSAPKNIPIVLYNRSNYDYHFVIKELANKLKKKIACLWENTKKYIYSSVPVGKGVTRNNK